jgi:GlcNAc-P-P-Und epimerase
MKILVTGSSGFIGGWVVRKLKQEGHVVCGLDVKPTHQLFGLDEFIECDLLDRTRMQQALMHASPYAVIHLAARVDLDETRDIAGYAANIDGVQNLIDAIEKTPSVRRVVYTSSQLVCRVGYLPSSESDYCPSTLYGESKVLTERIVRDRDGGQVEWCLARPTTVWGPHMSPHYQKLLSLIRRGLYFHVGSGKLHKSYSFAGNIAHQYHQLLQAESSVIHGRTFYLCDYQPLSLREYANALARRMRAGKIPSLPTPLARVLAKCGDLLNRVGISGFPFNSFRLNNILTEYVFDTRSTEAACGPLPYSFAEGIDMTTDWFMSHSSTERGRTNALPIK